MDNSVEKINVFLCECGANGKSGLQIHNRKTSALMSYFVAAVLSFCVSFLGLNYLIIAEISNYMLIFLYCEVVFLICMFKCVLQSNGLS